MGRRTRNRAKRREVKVGNRFKNENCLAFYVRGYPGANIEGRLSSLEMLEGRTSSKMLDSP